MLAPDRLREINLFVFADDLEPVTEALARWGLLHLEDVEPEAWKPSGEWADVATRLQSIAARLTRLLDVLEIPPSPGPAPGPQRPHGDLPDLEANLALVESRVSAWQERREAVERETLQLDLARSQVEALRSIDLPVEAFRGFTNLHVTIGKLPTHNIPRVAEALFQIPFVLVPLESGRETSVVLASCARQDAAILDRALESAFFEAVGVPDQAHGAPADALNALGARLSALRDERAALEAQRRALARELAPTLRDLLRRAGADARLADAMRRFTRHGDVYLIAGWVPARHAGELERRVREAASDRIVLESLPPAPSRRDVPTRLRAPRWLRPFASLVATFGLPAYDEIDPTFFAAAAFLAMYGMMFGDVGHGLVLALAALFLRRRMGSLAVVMASAGVSGALFGLLYGTVFGLPLLPPLWLQPLHDIPSLLVSAVAAGVGLLNLGFALNLISMWRARDWARFWVDRSGVAGIALYWWLLGGGWSVWSGRLDLVTWFTGLAVLALLLWFREPIAHRLWARSREAWSELVVTGFFELVEAVIGYVSNSLSFVRLGAFAVAHEGLSRVVLLYSGGRGGWLVLLVGTLLIVAFEGFIVGIQTLRLEYYEFFGRFFKGTGQPFKPLSLQGGQDETVGVRP